MIQSRPLRRPHRLAAQDGALSRLKPGFESPWGHTKKAIYVMALFFIQAGVHIDAQKKICMTLVLIRIEQSLGVQVISMISILARIAPGDVHLTRGQVDHQR